MKFNDEVIAHIAKLCLNETYNENNEINIQKMIDEALALQEGGM